MTTDEKCRKFDKIIGSIDEDGCDYQSQVVTFAHYNRDGSIFYNTTDQEFQDTLEDAITEVECFLGSLESHLEELKELR